MRRPSRLKRIVFTWILITTFVTNSLSIAVAQEADTEASNKVFLPLISEGGQGASSEISEAEVTQAANTDAALPEITELGGKKARGTDQIIVRYEKSTALTTVDRAEQTAALSEAVGVKLTYVREMSGDAIVLKLSEVKSEAEVQAIVAQIAQQPGVELAEPDAIMVHQLTPNDPRYGEQWHYFAPTAANFGANLPAAWDITTGAASVVVAVLDTGILNHADLAGRTVAGYDFIADIPTANDGNGRDADPSDPGDWCNGDPSSWHGTHVAGTIGAKSNNSLGVTGVNWQSKIQPVRVLGVCGGFTSDIADAIRWSAGLSVAGVPANATPAKVMNLSLGGPGGCSSTFQSAITAATNAGTVVVVAAGNSNDDAQNHQPSSCNGVITVASTNRTGSKAWYSNFGSTVEISAPGGDTTTGAANGVLSTLNTGTTTPAADSYAFYQGTSMAAPHVAGIVSLLFSLNSSFTPAQILNFLQTTVTPFPTGSSCTTALCGPGIVNAAAALDAVSDGFTLGITPASVEVCAPGTAIYIANVGFAGSTDPVTLSASGNPAGTTKTFNRNPVTPPNTSQLTIGNTTAGAPGTYTINVQGSSANGNKTVSARLDLFTSLPGNVSLTAPPNNSTGVPIQPTFSWAASAQAGRYTLRVGTDPAVANPIYLVDVIGTSHTMTSTTLSGNTTYYWKIKPKNACGPGNFSQTFSFTTAPVFCRTPNLAIPDADPTGVSDTVNIGQNGSIADLDVSIVTPHTYVGDLRYTLTHVDTGASVALINQPGGGLCSGDNINVTLDDAASLSIQNNCNSGEAYQAGGRYKPNAPLSGMNGQNLAGAWRLSVVDLTLADIGTLAQWCLIPTIGVPSTGDKIYLSSDSGGTVSGVAFKDEDVIVYDTETDSWAMHYDGSDVSAGATDVDALSVQNNGNLLISFETPVTLPGVGAVDDSDIVRFTPTSVGDNTAGSYAMYFDGSDVDLLASGENVDGFAILPDGRLLISVIGSAVVPGVSAKDEDLMAFTPTTLGANTSGTWSLYFDGSTVGLTGSLEDIGGAALEVGGNDILLSVKGAYSAASSSSVSGDGDDIFACDPLALGEFNTNCLFSGFFNGDDHGIGAETLDAIHLAAATTSTTDEATRKLEESLIAGEALGTLVEVEVVEDVGAAAADEEIDEADAPRSDDDSEEEEATQKFYLPWVAR